MHVTQGTEDNGATDSLVVQATLWLVTNTALGTEGSWLEARSGQDFSVVRVQHVAPIYRVRRRGFSPGTPASSPSTLVIGCSPQKYKK